VQAWRALPLASLDVAVLRHEAVGLAALLKEDEPGRASCESPGGASWGGGEWRAEDKAADNAADRDAAASSAAENAVSDDGDAGAADADDDDGGSRERGGGTAAAENEAEAETSDDDTRPKLSSARRQQQLQQQHEQQQHREQQQEQQEQQEQPPSPAVFAVTARARRLLVRLALALDAVELLQSAELRAGGDDIGVLLHVGGWAPIEEEGSDMAGGRGGEALGSISGSGATLGTLLERDPASLKAALSRAAADAREAARGAPEPRAPAR